MSSLLNFLANPRIYCSLIIVVFFVFVYYEWRAFDQYQKVDTKVVQDSIKTLKFLKKGKISVQQNGQDILKWITQHFEGEWHGLEFKPKEEKGDFILLSYPSILQGSVPRSPVYYAPTLLTALGILGTFLGISLGLQGVDLGKIKSTIDLINASTNLLSNMKVAFFTSLAGISTSILSMIVLHFGANGRREHRNLLRKELNEIAFIQTSERLLSRFDNTSEQETLKTLQSVAHNLSGFSAEVIGEAVGKAVKEAVSQENNLIVQELKSLRNIQKNQETTVENLVKQLRNELIEPVVNRLDQSAQLTQEASVAVKELKDELGGISQSLTGAVETIQTFQKDTLQELQQFASNLQSILAEFRVDTKGVMEQVSVEINRAVEQSIEGLNAQRTAFEESAIQASNTFRGIREDLQIALETQAKQQREMLQEVQASTESILEQANETFKEQSNTLITVGQEASDLMNQAKENLIGSLNNIDAMLQKTRQTVQTELERFRLEYQAALEEFFDKQNNLLTDTLGQQREGLAQVVADLQETFKQEAEKRKKMTQEIDLSLAKIHETVAVVNNLASAVGMNSSERLGQLQELARTIGGEAHRVEKAYQNMSDQFSETLKLGHQELNNYLQQASESYQKSFHQFDQETAQVCQELSKTSSGLMGVAEYLVIAANDLHDKQSFPIKTGITANGNGNGNGNKSN
jgi:hypothetical protein